MQLAQRFTGVVFGFLLFTICAPAWAGPGSTTAKVAGCDSPAMSDAFQAGFKDGTAGQTLFPVTPKQSKESMACSAVLGDSASVFRSMSPDTYNSYTFKVADQEENIAELTIELQGAIAKNNTKYAKELQNEIKEEIALLRVMISNLLLPADAKKLQTEKKRSKIHEANRKKAEQNKTLAHQIETSFLNAKELFKTEELAKTHCCLRGFEYGQSNLMRHLQKNNTQDVPENCADTYRKGFKNAQAQCSQDKVTVCSAMSSFLENSNQEPLKGCLYLGFREGLTCIVGASLDCRATSVTETNVNAADVGHSSATNEAKPANTQAGSADMKKQ